MVASRVLLSMALALLAFSAVASAKLSTSYYAKSCPAAESIIKTEVEIVLKESKYLASAFVRLFFHDCFVHGCDASVLLKSKSGTSELDSIPNQTLRGMSSIERIKRKLEKACPETVSCSDILAYVYRDSVVHTGGPYWDVEGGRLDGNISTTDNANNFLAPPESDWSDLVFFFAQVGLDTKDITVLSAAHTIGVAHCFSFSDSFYNFTGNNDLDPSINKNYLAHIEKKCPDLDSETICELDPGSYQTFDTHYFKLVAKNMGLMHSDRALLQDPTSAAYVKKMAMASSPKEFFADFVESSNKMGRIGVLTGYPGTVRKVCGAWID